MGSQMGKAAREAIKKAAGPANYTEGRAKRVIYASDGTGRFFPPEAVVRAVNIGQISKVLAACTAYRVPVVARGAGTGLTGGALSVAGGVCLDMGGLTRILRLDPADQVAVVEAGVITSDLQAAARAKGLFYPPDPASANLSTIGGNVAENAGGLRAVKYGVTRDYVLGLKAVLPDGRVLKTGSATMKSVVGYDLTRLLVASEGTLAVIVEATLKLLPLPEASVTISSLFRNLDEAMAGVAGVLAGGIRPVACEFMDASSLRAVEAHAGLGIDPAMEAMILIDLDGPPEVLKRQGGLVADVLTQAGGQEIKQAFGLKEAEILWKARRSLSPAVYQLANGKLNEDIAVPLGKMGEMIRRVQEVSQKRGVLIVSFGHAGDGNIHVNIMFDPDDPRQVEEAHQCVTDVFAHTLALGGTVSGEHGVGTSKLGFAGAEIDPVALELMHSLKKLFDPAGILNPHKALPEA